MRRQWFPLWIVPVIIGMAVGTVWVRLHVIRTTYSINQFDQNIRTLKLEREQLELKLAELRSPKRLEALAKSKFNLSQPRVEQVVYIK